MCDIITATAATAAASSATAATAATAGSIFTMANVGLAASALGTAATVYGQYQQGQAAKAQGEYQAAVYNNNQIIAQRNAELARQQGEVKARQQKMLTQQLIGSQRASTAASGAVVDTGSALISQGDTAALGDLSEQNIKYESEMEAYNYKLQAADYGSSAQLAQATGESGYRQGLTGAAGSLLVGGSQFADKWNKYKRGIG